MILGVPILKHFRVFDCLLNWNLHFLHLNLEQEASPIVYQAEAGSIMGIQAIQ